MLNQSIYSECCVQFKCLKTFGHVVYLLKIKYIK